MTDMDNPIKEDPVELETQGNPDTTETMEAKAVTNEQDPVEVTAKQENTAAADTTESLEIQEAPENAEEPEDPDKPEKKDKSEKKDKKEKEEEKDKDKDKDKIKKKLKILSQDSATIAKEILIAAINANYINLPASTPVESAEILGDAYNALLKKINNPVV